VTVSVKNNHLKVLNIWNVTHCGQVIDTNGADQQVKGCLIWGLSCALREEITSQNHLVAQNNFHDYQVARMIDIPELHNEFIKRTRRPTGLGEPAVSGVAPALSNAVFAATGKQYRTLPLNQYLVI
jgi:isoquinoline 1-oxidoreductase beta subunit